MREVRVGPEDWDGAIANTTGHQLVVAGPGTGKTEFLVRRAVHLVASGEARRPDVLVLGFSRRASADFRRRVDKGLGSTGVPIDITTFHSLALRLIETHGGGTRPTPLTTPEQVGLVADLLEEEEPAGWPITHRGILDTQAFATEVADFLLRCSERLLTPDQLEARVAKRPDWRGLPALLARYLDRLSATERTDYGAMLAESVRLLDTEEGKSLASRYRYVIVDEYQDTSPAQARMAELLALSGNLTVAGDPYQSIFSFRGAEVVNVADFEASHPDGTRLVLTQSFRVPTEILSSALRIVSGGDLPGAAGPVAPAPHIGRCETYVFDQETAEAEWIAAEVERSIVEEGVRPEAIAVLVRSKRELLAELSRALARRGIPHDPPNSRLVDHPAARLFDDLATVALLDTDTASGPELVAADRAMRKILLGPAVGLPLSIERDLARARARTGERWSVIVGRLGRSGLARLLDGPEWAAAVPAIEGFWEAWTSLDELEQVVADPTRSDWRSAWAAFAQVLTRQLERDRSISLARFFRLADDEDFEATPLLAHRPLTGVVTVTTLHQAKGLEFDYVFIANAVEGVFPDLRRGRRMLRPELLSEARETDPHASHVFQLQEEMRLAYTAMTRASLRVVWTATDAGVDQGEHRPSRFLVAASGTDMDQLGPPAGAIGPPVTIGELETTLRRLVSDPAHPAADRLAAMAVLATGGHWDTWTFAGISAPGPDSPIISGAITLSPSQAESYSTCPRRYALERRLRLGDPTNQYARFGSLVHAALERAERGVIGTGRDHATVAEGLEAISEVWVDADFGTPELDSAWKRKAEELVTKLYEKWPAKTGATMAVEMNVTADIGGVPWRGVVDRVDDLGPGVRIVDYKTSTSYPTHPEAETSIQLGFYAAALSGLGHRVDEAQLWYPRAPTVGITVRKLDLDRLDEVVSTMEDITTSILGEEWAATPGGHCKRCQFKSSCPVWPEGEGAFLP